MRRLCLLMGFGMALAVAPANGQGVGFLTENERLASYCAGVSEARMLDMNDFLKTQCTGSTRKECREMTEDLDKAKARDHRLWDYLTRQILTSKEQGRREKNLAQAQIAKGNSDWLACKRRDFGKRPEDLPVCRDTAACQIESRFDFLDQ